MNWVKRRLLSLYGRLVVASDSPGSAAYSGIVVGAITLVGALIAGGPIPSEFYAVSAQICPVLLIALVVEQRLANRLAKTESEFAHEARDAWKDLTPAALDLTDSDAVDRHVYDWMGRWFEYRWLLEGLPYENEEQVMDAARRRYAGTVASHAITIIFTVLALFIGEATALLGLLIGTKSADFILFPITISALAASFTVIVISAMGELVYAAMHGFAAAPLDRFRGEPPR